MTDDTLKEQEQLIALLLKNKDLIDDYFYSPLNVDCFDSSHRIILRAIEDAHEKSVLLTRKSFLHYISIYISKKQELLKLEVAYNKVSFLTINKNEYPTLREKILNAYLLDTAANYVRDFQKDRDSRTIPYAVNKLAANLTDLASSSKDRQAKIIYDDLTKFGPEYYKNMEEVRSGNVPDAEFVSYGIDELDKTSGVGLAPGTLTLFCGDVGGYKSTMMLNVTAHAWWNDNRNVLFVPLEMPKKFVYYKLLSRQTQVGFDYINNPKALTDVQLERLKQFMTKDWIEHQSKLFILESYEDRTRVSLIQKMIERNLELFSPKIVVVDYIANLQPDKQQNGRNDLEIGEMLKDLRFMGRPGVVSKEGFAIVSGAQIGREALKRVRRGSNDKAMFFSEDLRGSHEYSADADTIFAQFTDPQQPDERLQVFVVKARYGKKTFPDGNRRALLEIKPDISLIRSAADFYAGADKDEVLQKAASDDLDFGDAPKDKPKAAVSSVEADDFFK